MRQENADRFLTIAVADTNGLLRGQKVAASELPGILASGMGMSPAQLALDPTDVFLSMPGVTDGTGDFHDSALTVDTGSRREIPWEVPSDQGLYLAEFSGDAQAFCPRSVLRRVLDRAAAMDVFPKLGYELEFTLFNETAETLQAKQYDQLRTATAHASHDLVIYQAAQSEFYNGVADFCEPLGIQLAKMHEEIGGGFMEACIAANKAMAAADQAVLLKNFLRVFAMRRGQTISFMPRWSEQADSQSSHIHISLLDGKGRPCFWDAEAEHHMSRRFRHFIAGVQRYLPEFMLIFAPTVNSWRRFAEGTFAPPAFTWGIENRTTCLRVVGHSPSSIRVENRLPCADANHYLTAAASIAAGLAGIEQKLEPSAPTVGNGYLSDARQGPPLQPNMLAAVHALRQSACAKDWLGERFVETFSATREAQCKSFAGKSLIDERRRFFELG
ncbi:glutamine synthetase [Hydrogenophaga taeniospiralis CCUG 15921]|uniref:Glutamine synthetase n=1 Tax=Hydrogenophaga taeniospiralis CCUG 15921 TaxID=1281780 RepID=A0A9X4NUG3_9BURK|nr:glutamine synthetase family protein [Hydrogenophaga taeniospiralis]MDG5976889.1 glutamine synthetase [Hydrogenophaga taeniospiralis CCUG 15921]